MKNRRLALQALTLAACLVFGLFLWQGKSGFNIGDEGFLWYGAERVMQGEVPIRDFMAYDPGRYYWSAGLMELWRSNGIMALRASVAIFQAMGLFVGLFLIGRCEKNRNFLYLVISAITLIVWMYPRHKLFDISISIFLIGVLTFLVEKPVVRRYFLSGLCLGLVAVFGRNHGIYGITGSVGVMVWLAINRTEGPGFIKGACIWGVGIVVGFMPIFLMALLLPGFASAFVESIRFLFEFKATNLPLPIPWPWLVNWTSVSLADSLRNALIGVFFIGIPVFGVLSVGWLFSQRLRRHPVEPAFVAASFLALPYAHYAYSRADIGHLAQGIFPFLIGCLLLFAGKSSKTKWSFAIALCVVSFYVMSVFHPGWQCRHTAECEKVEISGTNLLVDPDTASNIEFVRGLVTAYAPNGGNFIVTPFWPSLYAIFDRRSPTWEIYALLPRSEAFQQAEIERIKKARPGFILVIDTPLDGRDELRFKNTHPLIYHYIVANFKRLPDMPDADYQVFTEK